MKEIVNQDEFRNIQEEEKAVVMFSASWCPDCHFIEPALPELEKNNEDFMFYLADRDELIKICQEYEVFGIPSFITFHKGKEVSRFVSKERKTPEAVQEYLNQTRKNI